MMKRSKQVLMTMSMFLLVGCGSWKPIGTIQDLPYSAPENAPQEYKTGWEHGCKTGFSAYGNNYYKTFYKFTQDVNMMKNPTYYKAWSDSYQYCRSRVNKFLAGHGFRKLKEGETPFIFSPYRINVRGAYDMRDKRAIERGGLGIPIFKGVSSPGWGAQAWGSNVACESDWLGRVPDGCSYK